MSGAGRVDPLAEPSNVVVLHDALVAVLEQVDEAMGAWRAGMMRPAVAVLFAHRVLSGTFGEAKERHRRLSSCRCDVCERGRHHRSPGRAS